MRDPQKPVIAIGTKLSVGTVTGFDHNSVYVKTDSGKNVTFPKSKVEKNLNTFLVK